MNFDIVKQLFTEYSFYSIFVSIFIGILFLVLDKPLSKCPKILKSYMPMLFSITAIVLLDYFFVKQSFMLKESLAVGIFCGSLSYAVTAFFRKPGKNGASNRSVLELSLIEIINDFADEDTASLIASEIIYEINQTSSPKTLVAEDVINAHFKNKLEPNSLVLLKSLISIALTSLKEKS